MVSGAVVSRPTQQPLCALHLLLYDRLHHLILHVLQELHHCYLLTCLWIINLWAGGVALWPQAAIDYMLGAASGGWGVGADVGVALEALVPAVQGRGQGCASDLNVYPGAAEKGRRMMADQKQTRRQT